MLDDKDIEKLKGTFLTKQEAEKLATKDDLEKFATKDFVKAEFDGFTTRMVELFVTKQEFQELKVEVSEMKESVDAIHGGINRVISMLENAEIDAVKHQLSKHERWHEQVAGHLNIKLAD
jgi:serine/threonine-protein kinase RIO1